VEPTRDRVIGCLILVAFFLLGLGAAWFLWDDFGPAPDTPPAKTITVEKTTEVPGPERTVKVPGPERTVEKTVEVTVPCETTLPPTGGPSG
jgi:multidrug efflux pump subunit AcrA (membrane-fusion protein)